MMKQLLAFPKKYEVTGKITKDRFLNSGNLTDAEKKVLELYLKNINILYDIRFLDQSEMIVLEIELTDAERGKYGLSNLVKAIAQSIPYLCMLLVRTEGVIRFFTFDRKENEFDDSRSRVRDICSSQDIIPIKEDISDHLEEDVIIKSLYEKYKHGFENMQEFIAECFMASELTNEVTLSNNVKNRINEIAEVKN